MRFALLAGVVAVLAAAGIAWSLRSSDAPVARAERSVPTPVATPVPTAAPARSRHVRASHCPAGVPGCRSVRGRVVYVESVDPDGDGDLHVVLAAGDVTLPGLTSVDVAPALRPARDPRVGDEVSAAGPVQRGSIGQSQIHALELHVRRARH
jgi:hypothetical protein